MLHRFPTVFDLSVSYIALNEEPQQRVAASNTEAVSRCYHSLLLLFIEFSLNAKNVCRKSSTRRKIIVFDSSFKATQTAHPNDPYAASALLTLASAYRSSPRSA